MGKLTLEFCVWGLGRQTVQEYLFSLMKYFKMDDKYGSAVWPPTELELKE